MMLIVATLARPQHTRGSALLTPQGAYRRVLQVKPAPGPSKYTGSDIRCRATLGRTRIQTWSPTIRTPRNGNIFQLFVIDRQVLLSESLAPL